MNSILIFTKKFGIYFLIFILIFSIRFFTIQLKRAFSLDDIFTYVSASPNNLSPEGSKLKKTWADFLNFEEGKTYNATEVKKALFAFDSSVNSIVRDLKTLRSANIDRLHTNLYYSIFRIWCAGFDGCDIDKMIKNGSYLNLIFFAFSYFFMYKLLSLIKDDKIFISFGLIFAFISSSSLMLNLIIREYSMQEMFFILICYVSLLILKNISQHKKIKLSHIFLYSFCFSLFLLSGYFSMIYFSLLLCMVLGLSIYKHNWEALRYLSLGIFITFVFTLLIYPDYFNFSFFEHQDYWQVNFLLLNLFNFNITDFAESWNMVYFNIKQYMFYPVIFFMFVILTFLNFRIKLFKSLKSEFDKPTILYILTSAILSFITFCFIMKIAFYKDIRYVGFVFIPLSLLLTTFTYLINKKLLQYIIVLIYMICAFIPKIGIYANSSVFYTLTDWRKEKVNICSPIVFANDVWSIEYIPYVNNSHSMVFLKKPQDYKFPNECLFVTGIKLSHLKATFENQWTRIYWFKDK